MRWATPAARARGEIVSRVLPAGTVLGTLADLPDGATRGFDLTDDEWPLRGFLVRVGDAVHAYLNRCPHAGRPLNFLPDRFLTPDGELIQCCAHGALFEKTHRAVHCRALRG